MGVSSQFLLSLLLWQRGAAASGGEDPQHQHIIRRPVLDDVVCFSLLWSGLTVALTFAACLSLRLLLPPVSSDGGDNNDDEHQNQNHRRVWLLRMEAAYISSSLVGICLAWIVIDLLNGMPEQVPPSLCMLVLSLACFKLILRCFPESECAAEEEEGSGDSASAADDDDAQPTKTAASEELAALLQTV